MYILKNGYEHIRTWGDDMSVLKSKIKRIARIMSPYKWGISVLIPVLLGVSLFLLKELNYLYMKGFSSFFEIDVALKARISLLYVFYIFIIILLIFIQCFYCVYLWKDRDKGKASGDKKEDSSIIELLIRSYMTLSSINVIIVYVYLQLSFSFSTTSVVNRSNSVYIQTIIVFLLVLSQSIIQDDHIFKRVLKLFIPYLLGALLVITTEGINYDAIKDVFIFVTILSFSILIVVTFVIWLSKNIKNHKRVVSKIQDSSRINEMILVTIAIIFILTVSSVTSLTGFIKDEGFRAAESMTDVLLVELNDIQYIAFDQSDHIIALEIKSDDGYYLKKGEYLILDKKNLICESCKIEFTQTILEDKIDLIFK